jgi:hypothetical protein
MRVSFTAIGLAFLEATIVKATVSYSLVPHSDKPYTISTKSPNMVADFTIYVQTPPEGHVYHLTPVNATAWDVVLINHSHMSKRGSTNGRLRKKNDPDAGHALVERGWEDGCSNCQK